MAYQDRQHGSDHGDAGRRRRNGERHGFGARSRFTGEDGRSRRSDRTGRDDGFYGSHGGSQRSSRSEHSPRNDGRYRDNWRDERRRDGDGGDRHSDRNDRRPARFNDHSGRKDSRNRRDDRRGRPPQRQRVPEPKVPDNVEPADLERGARGELRALGRSNAENVARHLVMVQRLLNDDPQTAYEHARYAASHAGRIAVVRETTGIAAYLAGHYSEALREIRAARRLSGLDLHRAIEVDCERALGNLDKALQAAQVADPRQLDEIERAELAMVVSSLRHDMGQTDLGLLIIEDAIRAHPSDSETLRRLHSVRADRLGELGRHQEAEAIRDRIGPEPAEEDDVEVFDIEDDYDSEVQEQSSPESSDTQPATDSDGDTNGEAVSETTEALEASDEAVQDEASADLAAHDEPVDQDEDAQWSQSFIERVEAEMAELLQDAHEPLTPSTNASEELR